ncbi:hypothetical protein PHYSODRAFT_524900 [Phytophthora sojae]|uniref:Uncharacterized protein n=1 Tax=Phytophthora sojae (strain P6497) TaxID=1094619 RepID=G5A696_PHYSP|nr:hypothetical protein PHYSODRAFT_524900 [Phytophthora sojae]EGZ08851.1 hypothetical protein PHYSODRAFT_524900 [Phytophthora sojae]|eukprot:XP_009535484.1 hypothetical protein PHYSODRAFT_524900 [Phytophthora sojae]
MVFIGSSILLVAARTAFALLGHVDAAPCDADNHSKVAAAVQTLHINCASWSAYLASGGVWNCDSTCHDAVINHAHTPPDCTFGGPYGQNCRQVVEGMAKTCGKLSDSEDTTSSGALRTTSSSSTQSTSGFAILAARVHCSLPVRCSCRGKLVGEPRTGTYHPCNNTALGR